MIFSLEKLIHSFVPTAKINLSPPLIGAHLATNANLINPNSGLVDMLKKQHYIKKVELKDGFINMWINIDLNLIDKPKALNLGIVNIESVSPNPTGPLHVGGLRNGVLARVLKSMYNYLKQEVETDIYINDQGKQVEEFIESVNFLKYGIGNLYYKGDYVQKLADSINNVDKVCIINSMVKKVQKDLEKMHIQHRVVVYESSLVLLVQKLLEKIANYTYRGYLENQKSEGEMLILNLSLGQTVLQRSDGTYTYFLFDLVYMYSKLLRGINVQICFLAEDHALHARKIQEVARLLNINYKPVRYAMVALIKDNKPLSLSKREGAIVTVPQVLEKYSVDEFYWIMIERNLNKVISFNVDGEQSEIVFLIKCMANLPLKIIDNSAEDLVWSLLIFWPKYIEIAVETLNPHLLAEYALKLAQNLKYAGHIIGLSAQALLKDICKIIFPTAHKD